MHFQQFYFLNILCVNELTQERIMNFFVLIYFRQIHNFFLHNVCDFYVCQWQLKTSQRGTLKIEGQLCFWFISASFIQTRGVQRAGESIRVE